MVQHQRDLLPVKYPGKARFSEHVDGHRAGDVVAQYQIQLRLDQIPGMDFLKPRVGCEDLLRHGHAHAVAFLSASLLRTAAQKVLTALM